MACESKSFMFIAEAIFVAFTMMSIILRIKKTPVHKHAASLARFDECRFYTCV